MYPVWKTLRFVAQSAIVGLAIAFVIVLIRPQLAGLGTGGSMTRPLSFAAAVAASSPAVANVYTERTEHKASANGEGDPKDEMLGVPERALGSAVVINQEGYLVTNWHVIKDADRFLVQLADGRTAVPEIVGTDPETELALLRIHLPNLPSIKLGRSDELEVGEVVLAIGDSLGLSHTVTMGIVSATGRNDLRVATFENFIQTDAAINVGNSGGALVNTKGELVGINTAVVSTSLRERAPPEGIGFAIPVNLVRGVMSQLIEHGRVIRGYLGVSCTQDVLIPSSAGLDFHGTAVQLLALGGPAAKAGLRPRDILTHINGTRVYNQRQAMNTVAGARPGTAIELSGYHADGTPFKTKAVLEERPPQPPACS